DSELNERAGAFNGLRASGRLRHSVEASLLAADRCPRVLSRQPATEPAGTQLFGELLVMMLLFEVIASPPLKMPPPAAAVFLLISVRTSTVAGLPPSGKMRIPPPLPGVVLSLTVDWSRVSLPARLSMPPPCAAVFSFTILSVTTVVPRLKIPPPAPLA